MALTLLLLILLQFIATFAQAASPAPERFGKTFAEIVSLAKKEGKVRFTSGTPDERQAKSFLQGFSREVPRNQRRIHSRHATHRFRGHSWRSSCRVRLNTTLSRSWIR